MPITGRTLATLRAVPGHDAPRLPFFVQPVPEYDQSKLAISRHYATLQNITHWHWLCSCTGVTHYDDDHSDEGASDAGANGNDDEDNDAMDALAWFAMVGGLLGLVRLCGG